MAQGRVPGTEIESALQTLLSTVVVISLSFKALCFVCTVDTIRQCSSGFFPICSELLPLCREQ